MTRTWTTRPRRAATAALLAVACVAAACGSAEEPARAATSPTSATTTTTTKAPLDATVSTAVQTLIDGVMKPGAIAWDCCGANGPATGLSIAVRTPGHEDLLLATGTNVDGTPATTTASFNVGGLTVSMVRTLAFQLIDEGKLDPTAPVSTWLPEQPNADRVTVQMLLDSTHGWGNINDLATSSITADFDHKWTTPEILDVIKGVAPAHEPGIYDTANDQGANIVLTSIMETLTGSTFADLAEQRIAQPAGLKDTVVRDGSTLPADYQYGVFVLGGKALDTSMFANTSYFTFNIAEASITSTLPDLLDLLDAWRGNKLFTTPRSTEASHFPAGRVEEGPAVGDSSTIIGQGVPFNGYCPCVANGTGFKVDAIGRKPSAVGGHLEMVSFADGTSIVFHFNSSEYASDTPIQDMLKQVHDTVTS